MSNAVQAQKGRNPQGQAFIPGKPHRSRSLEATCHTQVFLSKQVLRTISVSGQGSSVLYWWKGPSS